MTTPARTLNEALRQGTATTRLNAAVISGPTTVKYGWTRSLRPASSTSPRRNDGSRPPKAWEHRWGTFDLPYKEVRWTNTWWPGSIWSRTGPLRSGFGLDDVLSQVAPFCRLAALGTDYFPYSTYAEAVTNFLVKLQSNQAQLGVTMAEIRKTAGTVSSTCHALIGAVDGIIAANRRIKRKVVLEILHFGKVRKRRPGESVGSARKRMAQEKRVLDHWLQVQFGLKPLLGDISDIGQGLSHLLFVEKRAARISVKSGSDGVEVRGYRFQGDVQPSFFVEGSCGVESSCHISAVYEMPLSASRTFEQWGLANPAPVLWELTPFSWMLDYLSNTGKWVQSLVPITGARFIEGSVSYLQNVAEIGSARLTDGDYCTVLGSRSAAVTIQAGRFTRTVLDRAILPAYRPVLRDKLNLTRLANVLAVIGTMVSGKY